jgi:uncharacterized membrane protein
MNNYTNLLMISVNLIVFGLFFIMPYITRKELLFGIRLEKKFLTKDLKAFYVRKYHRHFASYSLLILLISISLYILLPSIYTVEIYSVATLLLLIMGAMIAYYQNHRKIKAYKRSLNISKEQVLIISTVTISEKALAPWTFLLPLGILLANVYMLLNRYNSIPEQIITKRGLDGIATVFVSKSLFTVLLLPLTSLFIILIMFIVYKSINHSKMQINSEEPEKSLEQILKSRSIWSRFTLFSALLFVVMFFLISLTSVKILDYTPLIHSLTLYVMPIAFIIITIAIGIYTGQGGANLKSNKSTTASYSNKDDDDFYKLGIFYYNPNDPSIFVEKRFGIGWSLNFGNKNAIIFLVLLLIVIMAMTILPNLLK